MSAQFVRMLVSVLALIVMAGHSVAQTGGGKQRLTLEARLSSESPAITRGIEWRIFGSNVGADGKLPLLASAFGGTKIFSVSPGTYLIHAAYGHAGAVKKVVVENQQSDAIFDLDAGGLKLNAIAATNTPIPQKYLSFDVFEVGTDEFGQRKLIAQNIKPDEIVPFPVGTYHVVSTFGDLNAEIRADLRVQPGKVTEASLEHRAALLTFRLVRSSGGDAIANTAWSILTDSGDVIKESSSAVPVMVLAEGAYSAIARNNDTIYSSNFEVKSGVFRDIEVLAEQ